nr:hypothetical protein [uncultured bacterium]
MATVPESRGQQITPLAHASLSHESAQARLHTSRVPTIEPLGLRLQLVSWRLKNSALQCLYPAASLPKRLNFATRKACAQQRNSSPMGYKT